MSTCVNFLNLWPGSLNHKHSIWKNRKAQISTNQMLKVKIEKQNSIIQRILKKKSN